MKIKFLRPVCGFAYFENDITDALPDERAGWLVANGYAILIPDTEGIVNTLPATLPAREILFNNGLETVADVRNAASVLTDFDGITKTTAKKITDWLNSNM